MDCHFLRDKIVDGLLRFNYLATHNQLADVFTKVLPIAHHNTLLSKLGIVPTSPPSLSEGVEVTVKVFFFGIIYRKTKFLIFFLRKPQFWIMKFRRKFTSFLPSYLVRMTIQDVFIR